MVKLSHTYKLFQPKINIHSMNKQELEGVKFGRRMYSR